MAQPPANLGYHRLWPGPPSKSVPSSFGWVIASAISSMAVYTDFCLVPSSLNGRTGPRRVSCLNTKLCWLSPRNPDLWYGHKWARDAGIGDLDIVLCHYDCVCLFKHETLLGHAAQWGGHETKIWIGAKLHPAIEIRDADPNVLGIVELVIWTQPRATFSWEEGRVVCRAFVFQMRSSRSHCTRLSQLARGGWRWGISRRRSRLRRCWRRVRGGGAKAELDEGQARVSFIKTVQDVLE